MPVGTDDLPHAPGDGWQVVELFRRTATCHAHPARRRCDGDSYSDRSTACHEDDTCVYHERAVRLYVR
jgi:hypothetical protein